MPNITLKLKLSTMPNFVFVEGLVGDNAKISVGDLTQAQVDEYCAAWCDAFSRHCETVRSRRGDINA